MIKDGRAFFMIPLSSFFSCWSVRLSRGVRGVNASVWVERTGMPSAFQHFALAIEGTRVCWKYATVQGETGVQSVLWFPPAPLVKVLRFIFQKAREESQAEVKTSLYCFKQVNSGGQVVLEPVMFKGRLCFFILCKYTVVSQCAHN